MYSGPRTVPDCEPNQLCKKMDEHDYPVNFLAKEDIWNFATLANNCSLVETEHWDRASVMFWLWGLVCSHSVLAQRWVSVCVNARAVDGTLW